MTDGHSGANGSSNGHRGTPLTAQELARLATQMFHADAPPMQAPQSPGMPSAGMTPPATSVPSDMRAWPSEPVVTDVITTPISPNLLPGTSVTPTVMPHVPVPVDPTPAAFATPTDPQAGYYFLANHGESAATGAGLMPGAERAPATNGDLSSARADFPALHQRVHGKPLIWLDNAATTQKPRVVIDALRHYYEHDNSNVHRGAHALAARATDAYEGARSAVARLLGAPSSESIVFVRGTTEGINLIAQTLGRQRVGPDDEIVLTTLEHHANIVPWQMLAKEKGARLRVVPVDNTGQVIVEEYAQLLNPRTRIVALSHVSNALGTILPVEQMIAMAHQVGAAVVVDGAQSVAHVPVDVRELDADFFVLSGHKIFAPTGIGAVYGRKELLDSMPPWQGGGSMIRDVTFDQTIYNDAPYKFEAGTPSIGDAVGLHAALDYVMGLGMPQIAAHEQTLTAVLMDTLAAIPGVRLIGTAARKVGVASFVIDGIPTERVGTLLDQQGIAVRSGHHCAQPTLRRFGLESTVRPSLAFYNTEAEIQTLGAAVRDIVRSVH